MNISVSNSAWKAVFVIKANSLFLPIQADLFNKAHESQVFHINKLHKGCIVASALKLQVVSKETYLHTEFIQP